MKNEQVLDVCVIGAGVLGCAIARELSRYRLDAAVLERAHDVGEGSSKANSGLIHAGFHPRGGSLKGTSCVQGNAMYDELCRQLQVPFQRCGGIMAAFSEQGVEKLCEKAERGRINGIDCLEIVDGNQARAMEPRLSKHVVGALIAPTTGIISPFQLVLACAQNAHANGTAFEFGWEVERIEWIDGHWRLTAADGRSCRTKAVVNAAGDMAAPLETQVARCSYAVRPRLGEWVVFDKQNPADAIRHVIYQAADTDEGGVLVAPTVDGNLLVGPTSRNVRDFKEAASSAEGIAKVLRVGKKVIPDLDESKAICSFAGVRTNIVNVPKELKDFVVRVSAPRFVSTLGIKNPGMTSSPALAKRAVDLLRAEGMKLEPRNDFDPVRERYVPFLQRDAGEQARLLQHDPRYANVICRCEGITEGDVRAVMREPLPPSSITGLKHRLRCTMGRCQGGFCLPHVADIMADEMGCAPHDVPYAQDGGRFVKRTVK